VRTDAANTAGKSTTGKTIVFGQVEIARAGVKAAVVKRNVSRGQVAVERLAKTLNEPGVAIKQQKDVPMFYVDRDDPDVIVRVLNGKQTRGRLVNGRFKAS
jgi:hypothetical protein